MRLKCKKIPCNQDNYYKQKRKYDDIKFIVIHYTGNNNDTAEANARYFQTGGRNASAHFFVGQDGTIVKSVNLNKIAWSVGGKRYANCLQTGGGKYYGICTNTNSVSIELCDNLKEDPSDKQQVAVVKIVKWIRSKCPNANYLIRHFDVTGKSCPARMTDTTNDGKARWLDFKTWVYKNAGMDKK